MEDFRKLDSATISKLKDSLADMEEEYDERQKNEESSLRYAVPYIEVSETIFVDLRSNAKESRYSFPVSMFTTREEATTNYASLFDKSKKYVFIDNTGEVSSFIVKVLSLFNYDVSYLDGGMNEFKKWLFKKKKEIIEDN